MLRDLPRSFWLWGTSSVCICSQIYVYIYIYVYGNSIFFHLPMAVYRLKASTAISYFVYWRTLVTKWIAVQHIHLSLLLFLENGMRKKFKTPMSSADFSTKGKQKKTQRNQGWHSMYSYKDSQSRLRLEHAAKKLTCTLIICILTLIFDSYG